MNFGKLLAKLNNDIKTEVRHLEKLKKKLINLRWSKCFYETCQEKNLMPKHIKIKHRDPGVLANQDSLKIKKSLLSLEINNCGNKICKLEEDINIKSIKVEQMLSEDYIELDLKDEILQELGAILDKTDKAKEN